MKSYNIDANAKCTFVKNLEIYLSLLLPRVRNVRIPLGTQIVARGIAVIRTEGYFQQALLVLLVAGGRTPPGSYRGTGRAGAPSDGATPPAESWRRVRTWWGRSGRRSMRIEAVFCKIYDVQVKPGRARVCIGYSFLADLRSCNFRGNNVTDVSNRFQNLSDEEQGPMFS